MWNNFFNILTNSEEKISELLSIPSWKTYHRYNTIINTPPHSEKELKCKEIHLTVTQQTFTWRRIYFRWKQQRSNNISRLAQDSCSHPTSCVLAVPHADIEVFCRWVIVMTAYIHVFITQEPNIQYRRNMSSLF